MFDQNNELQWDHLNWIFPNSAERFNFEIANLSDISKTNKVVTPALRGLLDGQELIGDIKIANLRYWDHDELLTNDTEEIVDFAVENFSKIAIFNRELESYYRDLGFRNIIYLDNWLRDDVFYHNETVIQNSVGYQSDSRRSTSIVHTILSPIVRRVPWVLSQLERWDTQYKRYEIRDILADHFEQREIILCEGKTMEDVASRMRESDIFLFFGADKGRYRKIKGEGFGLSLFEAMACGCVCVAKQHDGNAFLEGTIPLVETVEEAIETIENMTTEEKNRIRASGLDLIRNRYRFNEEKRQNMEVFLN
jgi:hypothetical protein